MRMSERGTASLFLTSTNIQMTCVGINFCQTTSKTHAIRSARALQRMCGEHRIPGNFGWGVRAGGGGGRGGRGEGGESGGNGPTPRGGTRRRGRPNTETTSARPPPEYAHQPSEWDQIVLFSRPDLYHEPLGSGERPYKPRAWKMRFDPALRAGGGAGGRTFEHGNHIRAQPSCAGRVAALASRNVERFRGGLVLKARRPLYRSTLGSRVKKEEEEGSRVWD